MFPLLDKVKLNDLISFKRVKESFVVKVNDDVAVILTAKKLGYNVIINIYGQTARKDH